MSISPSDRIRPCEPSGQKDLDDLRRKAGFLPITGGFQPAPALRQMDRALLTVLLFSLVGRTDPLTNLAVLSRRLRRTVSLTEESLQTYTRAHLAAVVYHLYKTEDADWNLKLQEILRRPTPLKDAALVYISAVAVWDGWSGNHGEGTISLNPTQGDMSLRKPVLTPPEYLTVMLSEKHFSEVSRRLANHALNGLVNAKKLHARMREALSRERRSPRQHLCCLGGRCKPVSSSPATWGTLFIELGYHAPSKRTLEWWLQKAGAEPRPSRTCEVLALAKHGRGLASWLR